MGQSATYTPKDKSYLVAQQAPYRFDTATGGSYFFNDASGYEVSEPAMASVSSSARNFFFTELQPLIRFFRFTQLELADLFELDSSTLSRWKKSPKPIGRLRSRVVRELDMLVAKGVEMFGTERAFQEWLFAPNASLGSVAPVSLLKYPEGVAQVYDMLDSLSLGVYS